MSKVTIILMIITAFFVDITVWIITLFHLIPLGITNLIVEISTSAVNGAASLVFLIWFISKGIKLISPKKVVTMCSGTLAGMTPIVGSILPVWTITVLFTIYFDKIERKTGISISGVKKPN